MRIFTYPFYGNDAALFAHLHDSQPAHALPFHVNLGVMHRDAEKRAF